MEIPKDLKIYYTIITMNGAAKAVPCPYIDPYNGEPTIRAQLCAESGNFYLTLKEAKADTEKINKIFKQRLK